MTDIPDPHSDPLSDPRAGTDVDTSRRRLTDAARRALAEAAERRASASAPILPPEDGGPRGPEPTRYGDWEKKGLAVDF